MDEVSKQSRKDRCPCRAPERTRSAITRLGPLYHAAFNSQP